MDRTKKKNILPQSMAKMDCAIQNTAELSKGGKKLSSSCFSHFLSSYAAVDSSKKCDFTK